MRTRGLGELGRDVDPTLRPFVDNPRVTEGNDDVEGDKEGVSVLRVGVDDLEGGRTVGEDEITFPGVCGREVGVEGLVFPEGRVGVWVDVGVGRVLEGVEGRDDDDVVRVVEGVEGLVGLVGVEGLM